MGYAVVDPEEVEPWDHPERDSTLRPIAAAADLSKVGVNLFEADPGEQLPLTYHAHEEQEELFYVLEGTLSVETPEETFVVEAGQAFVAEPESPHRAFVTEDAEESVRALAIGAPRADDVVAYEE